MTPKDAELVSVATSPPAKICGSSDDAVPVKLTVRNDSKATLQLPLDRPSGPPFDLNWIYYRVIDDSEFPGKIDWAHGPGGHGPIPTYTLSVEPGDKTDVVAWVYAVVAADYARKLRIEFEDVHKNKYTSASFFPCRKG